MAETGQSHFVDALTTPQHFMAPTARELRSQSVHRLQVGLFGLCAMLLIVGLANIIMDRAKEIDENDPIQDVVAVDAEPKKAANDPLADIGVIPAANPTPSVSATPSTPSEMSSGGADIQP